MSNMHAGLPAKPAKAKGASAASLLVKAFTSRPKAGKFPAWWLPCAIEPACVVDDEAQTILFPRLRTSSSPPVFHWAQTCIWQTLMMMKPELAPATKPRADLAVECNQHHRHDAPWPHQGCWENPA
jgi:hypothetical protein